MIFGPSGARVLRPVFFRAYCWADGPVAAVGVLEAELLEAEVQTVQDQSARWMSSLPSTLSTLLAPLPSPFHLILLMLSL